MITANTSGRSSKVKSAVITSGIKDMESIAMSKTTVFNFLSKKLIKKTSQASCLEEWAMHYLHNHNLLEEKSHVDHLLDNK